MQKVNILDHFLFEWVELLNSGKVTSLQLVEACLGRIQKHDNKIKSFTKVFNDPVIHAFEPNIEEYNYLIKIFNCSCDYINTFI